MEGRALDWLFRNGRTDAPAPSDSIVHLDIDDNALETVGAWPWPRGELASAVKKLDELGARVIALDILLIDPKPDEDEVLAQTMRDVKATTLLAAKVDEVGTRLSQLWRSAEGRRKWNDVLELLRSDITLDRETVIRLAELEGVRAARVRGRISAIKHIVTRRAANTMRRVGQPVTEETLRAALLPPAKNKRLRRFPELYTIRNVVRLAESLATVEARLPEAADGVLYARVGNVLPPLPGFASAVGGVGIVNAQQDGDGGLRRVTVRWEGGGRVYPQFGLAAAAAQLGRPLDFLAPATIEAGDFRLVGDEMLLSWPRINPDRPILDLAPHVSLGRVIDLRHQEKELEKQAAEREEKTRELVTAYLSDQFTAKDLDDPKQRPAIEAEMRGEAEMRAGEEEREGQTWLKWVRLTEEVAQSRRLLDRARTELRAAVRGKLVFVGWNATGNFGDFYPTAAHERTPGVVAHAVVANAVLTGYVVQPASPWFGALLALVLGTIAAVATSLAGPRLAFLITLLAGVAYFGFNTLIVLGKWNVAMAMTTPLSALFIAWGGTVLTRAVKDMREKAQLRAQFGARISKKLFDFLIEHPDRVHLDGFEREVTCFFSDLEGFTSISEKLDSQQTVAVLNQYMWAMNDELTQLNAYVNKFLGDGIMAVWGTFSVGTPHAEQACRAALACSRRLDQLNENPKFEGLPRLAMRIGIATGIVTVGDCGAPPDLRDYTVIGDSANLAARLESANKQFGTKILVNGRTRELLPDDLLTRPLGDITVVGQTRPTDVHELIAVAGQVTDVQRHLIAKTTRAIELFRDRKLDAAAAAWGELTPSPLADLYLEEIERATRAPEAFDGVLRLTAK